MISIKIDVTKIDKGRLFKGAKGTYLDLVLKDNKDGRDKYGYDGFVVHSVTKEEREKGVRGDIVGSWKHLESRATPRHATSPTKAGEDLPF